MDKRRKVLEAVSAAIATSWLAGCSNDSQKETEQPTPTVNRTSTGTRTSTTTPTPKDVISNGEASLQTNPRIRPPNVWTDENSLDNYTSRMSYSFESSEPIQNVSVKANGQEVASRNHGSKEIEENGIGIPVNKLETGETQIQVTAEAANGHTETTSTKVNLEQPKPFKMDLLTEERKDYRTQIKDAINSAVNDAIKNSMPETLENYLELNATDYNGFNNYSSPLKHDDWKIDPEAMEWWHDNDYHNILKIYRESPGSDGRGEAMEKFVESVDTPFEEADGEIKEAMTEPLGSEYPNRESSEHPLGHYEHEEFQSKETAREALDWLHPYMLAMDNAVENGPISTEDEKFAAAIQEAFDRYTDIEVHSWSFDLPEAARSTHGNGFIWDETNDELLIMETIAGPDTELRELHPKVENSLYLPPELREEMGGSTDKDDYGQVAHENWWHPIRFGWDGIPPEDQMMRFEDRKDYASRALISIGSGWLDIDRDKSKWWTEAGVGLTTEYVTDRIEKLRNYNSEDFNFEQLETESKIMNDLWANYDDNAVMYLDESNSLQVAGGVEEDVLEDVWHDQAGDYDDFDSHLEENDQEPITAAAS